MFHFESCHLIILVYRGAAFSSENTSFEKGSLVDSLIGELFKKKFAGDTVHHILFYGGGAELTQSFQSSIIEIFKIFIYHESSNKSSLMLLEGKG